jgi:TRAP-type uncharacterized transport system substrate-binding protein
MKKRGLLTFIIGFCLIAFLITFPFARAGAGPREPFELTISTLPAGFHSYRLGVGLAEEINKHSTWLKAIHIEGFGPAEHMKLLVTKPERRKNYLFFNTPWDIWEAKKGMGPYAKFPFKYDEFGFISLSGIAGNGLCTLNPKIKGVKDLVGKRVIFDSAPGKGRQVVYNGILEEAGVPLEKIKFQYSRGKGAADTLRDGLVDAIYTGSALIKLPNKHVTSPFIKELVAIKKTYFVSFDEKPVKAFKAKTGHPVDYMKLPPKALGPLQTDPCGVLIKPLGYCAHLDMPDHVITEVLRVIYGNAHAFKDYSPLGAIITQKTIAHLGIPEGAYHPAAVKFFKEKGIEITGFGF